jgi:non-specific serine/threonine protein kinase
VSSHPGEFTRFVGRRHELSEIRQLLSVSRLVTLTGIGGVGKTRIAGRVTTELSRTLAGRAWMVELADLHDAHLLGHTVAGVLGLQVQTGAFDVSLLTECLAEPALLTLDNCEHLGDASAALVTALLEGCPELTVLATSRMPLGISGETVYLVPPLSVPDADHLPPVEAFAQYESITLFLDRATAALPSLRLTEENAEPIARLVASLEGLPLALELAAARIRVLSPQAMLERIHDRYRLLNRGYRNAPARQQSLMASVVWSFDLCTPAEQRLWTRLSVFAGGFELEDAEAVCSGDGLERAEILDLLSSLLDKSVLVRHDDDPVRYRMLETIRQYGVARLEASGELDHWSRRHRDWYASLAERCAFEWLGPDQVAWIKRLTGAHPNLRAALEFAASDPAEATVALGMCHNLEQYWLCTGLLSEGRHWCEHGLADGIGTAADRAMALAVCVWFATMEGDLEEAERLVEQARVLAEESNDVIVVAEHRYIAALLTTWQGEVERALPVLIESLEIFRAAGHRPGEVNLLFLAGMCHGFAKEYARATSLLEECLALTRPVGELFIRSYSLWALGLYALNAGETKRATRLEREALRLKGELQDRLGTALVLETLGWVAGVERRGERAATLLGAADAIWQVIGLSLAAIPYIAEQREQGRQLARGSISDRDFDEAFRRGRALTPEEARAFALEATAPAKESAESQRAPSPLTPREEEIALLVGEGLTNRAIATRLLISQRTAQGHVENILRKLGFTSRTQVAAWVAERRAALGENAWAR